ncbi:MAG: cyclic nucleotide-binding domain-containing protein [Pseudomonadales bacterium]|nr:cyclic nucleotide-binding domain-containing protein [Pseudomonadales bacterium]
MGSIAVISSDDQLNNMILDYCESLEDDAFIPFFLSSTEKARLSLDFDLPQIAIINCIDKKIDTPRILETLRKDPWLHSCGIIALHNETDESKIHDMFKDTNLIASLQMDMVESNFGRVLRILQKHSQMIFHTEIQGLFSRQVSCNYELSNDPFDVHIYANIVENFLFNMNLLEPNTRGSISIILIELLMNAIEHGNCDISFEEKSEWMKSGHNIFELIMDRQQNLAIAKKRVSFSYTINPDKSTFTIRDEGNGFDHEKYTQMSQVENIRERHGRGILMANFYAEKLHYNTAGNECTFVINHLEHENNTVPIIFQEKEATSYKDGEIIFSEGDSSDDLYYIVSGKFNIISNGRQFTKLTSDDIFLGEMSFLLNHKRSATVVSDGTTKLIKISKRVFVNAIKQNPHYGIFLARLLAQRLSRASQS